MAARTSINVDADGRPDAAGADTVKTVDGLIEYLGQGMLSHTMIATAAFCAANVKGTAGTIFHIEFFNYTAAALYLKLYNLTATPDPSAGGSNVPFRRLMIPPMVGTVPGALVRDYSAGIACTTGIGYVIVSNLSSDTNETALSAGDVSGNIGYL